ncbi:hypothetical protein E4U61_004011 [Claviceps capensis]|nr:hypothetical protein E4U61_004011 [Claviceps capensis]
MYSLAAELSYPDEALLLNLTTALDKDNEYKSTTDSLASRDDLSVEQKANALQEMEHRLRETTPAATNAERVNAVRQRQRQGDPRTKQQDSNASDDKSKCFCCDSTDYLFGRCKYRDLVRKQRIKDEEDAAKGTKKAMDSQPSSPSSQKKIPPWKEEPLCGPRLLQTNPVMTPTILTRKSCCPEKR